MPVFGSSVLAWSHRVLTVAVETGSRLLACVATVSGGGGRPAEQRRVEVAAPVVSSGGPQHPPGTPPRAVAGRARETVATSEPQGQRPVSAGRAATASVTPAMVRRWAHEQGVQVADRGRIPRSVMDQYLAQVVQPAARGRRTGPGFSKGPRPPSGRPRSSAA